MARFSADQVRAALRDGAAHTQYSRLVSVENTTNIGGGAVWDIGALDAVAGVAHEHGLSTHMDGARLLNAVVASGRPAAAFARGYDSAWIDMSKGLGAPVGGVLAGTREFIAEALRFKHQFGGAMRQAGIIAAAGIYALHNNVSRLAEDHDNARRFARLIARIEGIDVEADAVDTNMVFFNVAGTGCDAHQVSSMLLEYGVRIGAIGEYRMRAVTHLDVDAAGVEEAARALSAVTGA